jgi:hypothetical protein
MEILQLPAIRFYLHSLPCRAQLSTNNYQQTASKVKVALRLAVYRQSVRLKVKPLEIHDQRFFPTEPLRPLSLYNILSEKMGLSVMNMLGFSSSVRIAHIACYWKCSSFCTTHKSSVSTGFGKQIIPISHILCYNGSLVTWTVVSLTAAKFQPLTSQEHFRSTYSHTWLPITWVAQLSSL